MPRRIAFSLAAAGLTMACSPQAMTACFAPGTTLPDRAAMLKAPGVGESVTVLVDALTEGDIPRVRALLVADPALAKVALGSGVDMLTLAVRSCDREAVDLLIEARAPLDGLGGGLPLTLALRARDPWFAERLLRAGARPNPAAAPTQPMRTAIGLNSLAGVAMLLDAGADPNLAERTGARALHTALDMERFRIAELLIDRGADPWAIDAGGANLATSAATPMMTDDVAEAAAQRRLTGRVAALGWPQPAPDPRAIRALALAGSWPPASAKAPPVLPAVLKLIGERAR